MYFVDKRVLNERLDYIEDLTQKFSDSEGLELERICHMLIEATVDVGNMIIDGFILRDPGSYKDVMDVLENEKAISPEDNTSFAETFGWRQKLIRDYTNIDHAELKETFRLHLSAYTNYKQSVYHFIDNDGQVVTAFTGGDE